MSWLNLHKHIPQRDLRKKIYSYLDTVDRLMIRAAHFSFVQAKIRVACDYEFECYFLRLILHAARLGYMNIVRFVFDNHRKIEQYKDAFLNIALVTENVNLLTYMSDKDCFIHEEFFLEAIRRGSFKLLEWETRRRPNYRWCEEAIEAGKLDVFAWLLERGATFRSKTLGLLFQNGHFELIQMCQEKRRQFKL